MVQPLIVREAIRDSVEHWMDNLQMLILNHLSDFPLIYDIEIYPDTCPLCALFYNQDKDASTIVPIKKLVWGADGVAVEGMQYAVREWVDRTQTCLGCPISIRTGRVLCGDSPWMRVRGVSNTLSHKHMSKTKRSNRGHTISIVRDHGYYRGYKRLRLAIEAEIEFLESLLEEV